MKIYCDLTGEGACVGILPNPGTELILTGTLVHVEPEKLREFPLAVRLAGECGLHFWFGSAPEAPFYTVPKTEVFAHDSRGGYFITTGDPALDWSEPLYYIDGQFGCHRLIPVGENVADMGQTWRDTMVSCDDIEVFPDRAAAEERYPIRTLKQFMEEQI